MENVEQLVQLFLNHVARLLSIECIPSVIAHKCTDIAKQMEWEQFIAAAEDSNVEILNNMITKQKSKDCRDQPGKLDVISTFSIDMERDLIVTWTFKINKISYHDIYYDGTSFGYFWVY